MNYGYLKLRGVVLLILGCMNVRAQETVLTSGGNATGSGGSVSYSIGQTVYTTNTGINGSMAQGVQQAFEISIVSSIKEAQDIKLVCSAYPNPTSDLLFLKVENYDALNLSYQLYDSNGKLIKSSELENNEATIDMNNLHSAIYFLHITEKNKQVKLFKIIKN